MIYADFVATQLCILRRRYDYTEGKILTEEIEVEVFSWEKLDKVSIIKKSW